MQSAISRDCTDVPVQQNLEWSISIKCKVVVVSTAALRRLRSHRPRGRPTQTKGCAYICSSLGGITRTQEMIPRRVGLLNSECLVPRPTMHSSVSLKQGSASTTRARKSSWGRGMYSVSRSNYNFGECLHCLVPDLCVGVSLILNQRAVHCSVSTGEATPA